MPVYRNPPGIAPPASRYSHTVTHGAGRRMLIAGQVGMLPDGRMADGLEAQMRRAMANLLACLGDGGFAPSDLVRLTAYCVPRGEVARFRAIREEMLEGHAPASTWLEVAALASPDWLFEVDGEAVRED